MSDFAVTIEQLKIYSHPNADVIELAQVGEYRAVVRKGQFTTGDYALYIPEQALVSEDLLEEIGLVGKLAGSKKNRVKAMRFRGELSQGIVCLPSAIATEDLEKLSKERRDFSQLLGIEKWVPEVPSSLSGEVFAAPELMRWIEIENIKRYPAIFSPGEEVIATEKVHGSCCVATLVAESETLFVSSKGFASKNFAIKETENNLYWRAIRSHNVEQILSEIATELQVSKISIYAEVFGSGVQDLHYGFKRKDTPGFAVFDVAVEDDAGNKNWLTRDHIEDLSHIELTSLLVPVLYEGPYEYKGLAELASGKTVIGDEVHIREGLVVRPKSERYSEVLGGRAIAKFISEDYLTRQNGTEYE